jgi:hypothetical protein
MAVVIDPTGFLAGIGVGVLVLLSVYVIAAGFLIFRRVTGL